MSARSRAPWDVNWDAVRTAGARIQRGYVGARRDHSAHRTSGAH